jgi:hypothetical protein
VAFGEAHERAHVHRVPLEHGRECGTRFGKAARREREQRRSFLAISFPWVKALQAERQPCRVRGIAAPDAKSRDRQA